MDTLEHINVVMSLIGLHNKEIATAVSTLQATARDGRPRLTAAKIRNNDFYLPFLKPVLSAAEVGD